MTETVTEVLWGQKVKKNWHLKNWKRDVDILKENAKCTVEVEFEPDRPPVKLCFFLKETLTDFNEKNEQFVCASLFASVADADAPILWPLAFAVKIYTMNEKWGILSPLFKTARVNIASRTDAKGKLVFEEFRRLRTDTRDPQSGLLCKRSVNTTLPEELRLQIEVVPLIFSDNEGDIAGASGDASTVAGAEASLSSDFKKMFLREDDNLADLKLEMKDNMTLTAHRFVLAARSPFLNARILKEMKNNDFKGTIKIPEVNSKPMGAILHWMYSGEVEENAGRCMEEVVEAAKKFGLDDMIRVLDKKLIGICNAENMFDLFKVAQKNGMATAIVEVSDFIRESLANLVPNRRK